MAQILLVIAAIVFFFLFPFAGKGGESGQAPMPTGIQRACLSDSDIETGSVYYTCPSGAWQNANKEYYLVKSNLVLNKKVFFRGDLPPDTPSECVAGINIDPTVIDRELRLSKRCVDPGKTYESWCGDYCTRVLQTYNAKGQIVPNGQFCDLEKNDDYLGCLNRDFLFILKDPPFNPNGPNTFDLVIQKPDDGSDPVIPQCITAQEIVDKIKAAANPPLSAAQEAFQLRCYQAFSVNLRCN